MGYSRGGGGSWLFAKDHSEISSAIPIASSFSTDEEIEVPIYVIHGENDELFPLSTIGTSVQHSNSAGSNIRLEVAGGLIHDIQEVEK